MNSILNSLKQTTETTNTRHRMHLFLTVTLLLFQNGIFYYTSTLNIHLYNLLITPLLIIYLA